MDQGTTGDKLPKYIYIFKIVDPMRFAKGLDVEYMKKKKVNDNSEDFLLSNWKYGISFINTNKQTNKKQEEPSGVGNGW